MIVVHSTLAAILNINNKCFRGTVKKILPTRKSRD